MFGRRLIDDARHAWSFGSMQFMALGGAIQAGLIAAPAAVTDHVPDWVMQAAATISLFCIMAGMWSRVTVKKDDPNARYPDPPDAGR